jgi:alpha/beta superfamily hydrolase
MHSPVPLAIARMLAERASDEVAWARFNMRGVGASEGTYDGGRGELEDARSVFGYLGAQCTGVPAAVCGHSFGAWVGFRLAVEEAHADRALLVAPTPHFTFEPPGEGRHLRVAVFIGDCDELAPVAEAMAIAHVIGADLRVFPGYDHHFLKSRRALAEAALPVIAPEVASP